MSWFSWLPVNSIISFAQLCRAFVTCFQSIMKHKKMTVNLLSVKQKPDELIQAFVSHFNKESLDIKDPDEATAPTAMSNGLSDMDLKDLAQKLTKNMAELLERCNEFANTAEVLQAQKANEGKSERKRSTGDDCKEEKRSKTNHRT
ncbi:uncharacterized protein LOC122650683 [Telopea speciosissima]|uniref:uncharacterized protein LOC122650683 n=1 Tax=Telopea speciosissima TaxID=54955 RepID=UPI001CC7A838|nr:uncharacterized protein LOC122650683 [Telopea speciosissima]